MFVVVNIGCLKCRALSKALGLFNSLEAAQQAYPEAVYVKDHEDVDQFALTQTQILEISVW